MYSIPVNRVVHDFSFGLTFYVPVNHFSVMSGLVFMGESILRGR